MNTISQRVSLVKKAFQNPGPMRAYVLMKVLEAMASSWMFSTHVLYLKSSGLTEKEIFNVNVVFMSIRVILDPLTGSLGDKIGQRKTYLLGLAFWAVGMFTYGLSYNLYGFYLAEGIAGIGFALVSEALESWLQNTVGASEAHASITSAAYLGRIPTLLTSTAGALLGTKIALNLPYFLDGSSHVLLAAFGIFWLFRFPKEKSVSNGSLITDAKELLANLRAGLSLVSKSTDLRYIMVIHVISGACFQPFNQLWALILTDVYVGDFALLPYMWAMVTTLAGLGEFFVRKARVPKRWMIGLWIASIGLPMMITGFTSNATIVLSIFLLHEVGRGAINPLLKTYAAIRIPNHVRTTASSFISAMRGVGAIMGLLVFGSMTDYLSNQIIWSIAGVILFSLAVWAGKTKPK